MARGIARRLKVVSRNAKIEIEKAVSGYVKSTILLTVCQNRPAFIVNGSMTMTMQPVAAAASAKRPTRKHIAFVQEYSRQKRKYKIPSQRRTIRLG